MEHLRKLSGIQLIARSVTLCFLISTMLIFVTHLGAQEHNVGTIRGSIRDESSDRPLEFVNVVVRTSVDSLIVAGKVTNETGRFEFTDVLAGRYFITFSLIGYSEKATPIFVIDSLHKQTSAKSVSLQRKCSLMKCW